VSAVRNVEVFMVPTHGADAERHRAYEVAVPLSGTDKLGLLEVDHDLDADVYSFKVDGTWFAQRELLTAALQVGIIHLAAERGGADE